MQGRGVFLPSVLLLVHFAVFAHADLLLERHERETSEPVTRTETLTFPAPEGGGKVGVIFRVAATRGSFHYRLEDPSGGVLIEATLEPSGDVPKATLDQTRVFDVEAGNLRVVLTLTGFAGHWRVMAVPVPDASAFMRMIPSGILMTLVAIVAFAVWAVKRPGWRWFAAGAGLWVVGVALKFACAIPLNPLVISWLESSLPHGAYLGLGSLYIGLLTGVFEMGPVWLVARWWRGMSAGANRAVAVGVGAGAIEALLLGLSSTAGMAAMAWLPGIPDPARVTVGTMMASTPLLVLVGCVERIITILCHVGSRTLVLYAVARRRAAYGWLGFALMTLIDAVAGYLYLAGLIGIVNMWWVEAALAPFALLGLYATLWCIRHWPGLPAEVGGPECEAPSVLVGRQ